MVGIVVTEIFCLRASVVISSWSISKVLPGSIKHGPDGSLEFTIYDGGGNVNVAYSGIVPDIFKDDVEAVVEGEYGRDNLFVADVLLAKCPTKYESTEALYKDAGPGDKGVKTY